MPRGRPKGTKNKAKAVTTEKAVKAAVKKTQTTRAKTDAAPAAPAAQDPVKKPRKPRAPRVPKITVEAPVRESPVYQTAAESLKRIDAQAIKTEKIVWGQWPPIDTPVYLVGFKSRKFSFLEPFECGRDQGVLVVDYAKRHDRFPPEKFRIEARFVAYEPIS